ncbi:hypothetical protein AW40_23235 [Kosakonia radicincitans UMEnt01/12]|nr:hypothetical protein AW40_23235 [Kosakonia radicincitans UMEnt01/12]
MGDPWFKIREQQYSVYFPFHINASLSNRVMSCLEELAPRVEQYSIDEMFLDLRGVDNALRFEEFGVQLREHVYACTRLTIGVGMGPTKTLAKSAQTDIPIAKI